MIGFRDLTPADEHFVVSSWTQSFRTSPSAGFIQDEDWYPIMDLQIAKAIRRPDVRTIVAFKTTEPDVLIGFLCADTVERPPLVYYVYVKSAFRRGGRGKLWRGPGLARQMFAELGIDPVQPFNYVCSTEVHGELIVRRLARKIPQARWRPLLGRFSKTTRRSRT